MVIPCKVWDGLSELQAWEAGMVDAIVAFLFILAPAATPTRPRSAGRIETAEISALQELSGFAQQGFDAIQCGQFLVGHIVSILELLAQLELHHLLPLLNLHQALG
jgi:hypothetical protein